MKKSTRPKSKSRRPKLWHVQVSLNPIVDEAEERVFESKAAAMKFAQLVADELHGAGFVRVEPFEGEYDA